MKLSPAAQAEEAVLATWQKENTFAKSLENRKDSPVFSFYDGPPFANGLPHFGHSLVTSIKDGLGRYKTMRGYYVPRRNGWDTHGLPVEFAIEKEFGVSGKKQILELGIEKFNQACRDSVFKYRHDHEEFFRRIGRWTDTEHAYATIDRSYTESVWWVMKQVHQKGLLYRGYKSLAYCPRCETPLSNFELNEGYKDNVEDPSLYVKFKLKGQDAYMLAWTTTPWSLPGNAALAVKPDEAYVYAMLKDEEAQDEVLVLAKKRISEVLKDESSYEIIKEVQGKDLAGLQYEPLYPFKTAETNLYKVWAASFVDIEDGSGILHVAPAFGEDDLALAQENNIPVLTTVDPSGHISAKIDVSDADDKFFKSADRPIIEDLSRRKLVFASETFHHTYPFCYRCESPLLYYAVDTWFIKVSEIRSELVKTAKDISWTPDHIKSGRFGKWLEGARDWAISRNRYWGAPMPIWANIDDPNDYIVVGSIDELKELAGDKFDLSDLHRPFIDKVEFAKDGKTYRRIEEVLDCWFESGSMPVAQQHYPFDDKQAFEKYFPADYIGEGLDQTRLWFYVLHIVSTILFDKPAYKNVLVNGMILAADGQKLSKRLNNYPPIEDVFANEGADALRLYLLSNNQAVNGDYMRFDRDGMRDIKRNVLDTLNNSFRFFKMYADIDGWQAPQKLAEPASDNILDQWILSRLNQTIQEASRQADDYKLARAIQPVFELLDDTSNWYIRRSRRRFWKSEDDSDKSQAYTTLHYVLARTCQLLAPWAPFLSDQIYRELVGESVHLSDWPESGDIDEGMVREMEFVRLAITEGLKLRAEAGIKVRQPLASAVIWNTLNTTAPKQLNDSLLQIAADELNVKKVSYQMDGGSGDAPVGIGQSKGVDLNTGLTDELKAEGVARELIRNVQALRKQADLQVDDRIILSIQSPDKLVNQALQQFGDLIAQETLATEISNQNQEHKSEVIVEDAQVGLSLSKGK